MNGHCSTCDVEQECGYKYKPCDCCNYRKFTPINPQPQPTAAEREARRRAIERQQNHLYNTGELPR